MEVSDIAAEVNEQLEKAARKIDTSADDEVNHPRHYTTGKIETTDYLQDKLTPEMFEGFCVGCALKYLSRYRLKGGLQDLKKAEWYLNRIIKAKEEACCR